MTRPTVFVVNDAPVETADGSLSFKLARHRLRAADMADALNAEQPGNARVIPVLPPDHPEAAPDRIAYWQDRGVTVRRLDDPALSGDFQHAHVVMTQTEDARYQQVAKAARAAGAHLTVDFNDNYFAEPPADSNFARPGAHQHYIAMARLADTRLVNTAGMAEALNQAAETHGFPKTDAQIAEPVGPRVDAPHATVGKGFHIVFDGHSEHMKAVADAAEQILKKTRPHFVTITIVSNLANLEPAAQEMVGRETRRIMDATDLDRAAIGFIPWTPDAQRRAYAQADLVIAPRADNPDPWGAVKSAVPVTEAIRRGRMVMASDSMPSFAALKEQGLPIITTPNSKFGETVARTMRQMMRDPRRVATDIAHGQAWLEQHLSTAGVAHRIAGLGSGPAPAAGPAEPSVDARFRPDGRPGTP